MSFERSSIGAEPERFVRQERTGPAGDVVPIAAQRQFVWSHFARTPYHRADYRPQTANQAGRATWLAAPRTRSAAQYAPASRSVRIASDETTETH
jgi:hypothetical protein